MTLITKTWHPSILQESNNLFYSFIFYQFSFASPQTPSCYITIRSLFYEIWIQTKVALKEEGAAGHKIQQTQNVVKKHHDVLI